MTLKSKREEFFNNVWDHTSDPFQMMFDVRRPLSGAEINILKTIHQRIQETDQDASLAVLVKQLIEENGFEVTALLLQLSGLTRSKIISDLKASHYCGSKPSSYKTLHRSGSWQISGLHIARSLRKILKPIQEFDPGAMEALNQATYPGFIRQERAKRQGHEAEYRLACLWYSLGIPFEPSEKVNNPLCKDASIHGESFDLVAPSIEQPLILVKCTVHTANIGQYGESKDAGEIEKARTMIKTQFSSEKKPILLAFVDGIGLSSNSAGLNALLKLAEEFCQFRTLWKAAVIAASQLGFKVCLSAKADYWHNFQAFLDRYSQNIKIAENLENGIEAGDARVAPC